MTQDTPRFDDSLPRLAQALIGVLGADAVQTGQFLRNANGQLAFISAESMQEAQTAAAQTAAETAIGRYARTHSAVLQPTQPGLASLRQQARAYSEQLALDSGATLQVSVLEQRIVGQDWLHAPVGRVTTTHPSLHVFFSIKGGVGRSTALAVSAARHPGGHRVELWARDPAQASAMQAGRENARYLPGIALPPALAVRGAQAADLTASGADH